HEAERLLVAGIGAEARGDRTTARDAFKRAADMAPQYALACFWLGRSCELAGEPAAAIMHFREALARNSRSIRTRLHLARVQTSVDADAALSTVRESTALVPDHAPSLLAMGQIFESREDHSEARRLYQQAAGANPFMAPAFLALGRVCGRL